MAKPGAIFMTDVILLLDGWNQFAADEAQEFRCAPARLCGREFLRQRLLRGFSDPRRIRRRREIQSARRIGSFKSLPGVWVTDSNNDEFRNFFRKAQQSSGFDNSSEFCVGVCRIENRVRWMVLTIAVRQSHRNLIGAL